MRRVRRGSRREAIKTEADRGAASGKEQWKNSDKGRKKEKKKKEKERI